MVGNVFKKKAAKEDVVMAKAPEEPESKEEIEHMKQLADGQTEATNYREIPVCLSQAQVNNMIIENNIMLKQLLAN